MVAQEGGATDASFQSSQDVLSDAPQREDGSFTVFSAASNEPENYKGGWRSEKQKQDSLRARWDRREKEQESWRAYWHIREVDSRGSIYPRMKYYLHRAVDTPVTWFRERVAEPLQDKYKQPFYHRRLPRVTEIDQCAVTDWACVWEANEQYRIDKTTDWNMLNILRNRLGNCLSYYGRTDGMLHGCAKMLEQYEENELNFFMKYGEMGSAADVRTAYMKQKHRQIWERRHPLVMQERKRVFDEHKQLLAQGIYDGGFWKSHLGWYQDKKAFKPPYKDWNEKLTIYKDQPLSKDPLYYKKKAIEGPDAIDPSEGFSGGTNMFPLERVGQSGPNIEDMTKGKTWTRQQTNPEPAAAKD